MNRMNPKVAVFLSKGQKLCTAADTLVSVLNFDSVPIRADSVFRLIKEAPK
jgi:hypothetical protein